jgi:hypothetical protein
MDRRGFLTTSVAAATAIGCGASLRTSLGDSDSRELIERLERGLARIDRVPEGDIARRMPWHRRPDLAEEMFRLTLGSLVVADVVRSAGASAPPALSQRLAPVMPLVDHTTETQYALLSGMPSGARRALSRKMRERPDTPMEVAEWIDGHAAELGISSESRVKLRTAAMNVAARMRRQSTDAVIDDAVAKVEGVAAVEGSALSIARSSTTSAMIHAIWQESGIASGGLGDPLGRPVEQPQRLDQWRDRSVEDAEWRLAVDPPRAMPQWSSRWARPGDEERTIGYILMPLGLASCGLLLIIGIIVLIAGHVQNNDWDGQPRVLE